MFMIWTYGQPTAVSVNNTDSMKGTGSTRYQMTNGCETWCLAMGRGGGGKYRLRVLDNMVLGGDIWA